MISSVVLEAPMEKHHQVSEFWVQPTHFTAANSISDRRLHFHQPAAGEGADEENPAQAPKRTPQGERGLRS